MLTLDSKTNKQIVKNLEIEGLKISKEDQQLHLLQKNNQKNRLERKIKYFLEVVS